MLSLHDREVGTLLRLAAEVADLPEDKVVRRRHILNTLKDVVGAAMALCFEPNRSGGKGLAEPGSIVASDNELFNGTPRQRYLLRGDPVNPTAAPVLQSHDPFATSRRSALMNDALWYGSEYFHTVMRPMNLDDSICSRLLLPDDSQLYIAIHREIGDEPFTERDCGLVQFFNTHAAALYHVEDKSRPQDANDPRLKDLPPRLRPVLLGFLDGDGEKQVATKLGLSPHTVHQYAKLLYRHFDVSSRGELLSQFIGAA
jgi:hypothetical protein